VTERKYKGLGNAWQDQHWNFPPSPFNPLFDERAAGWHQKVIDSMQTDGLYETMEIPERKAEFRKRYDAVKAAALGSPSGNDPA
jgi:hypothetical protein